MLTPTEKIWHNGRFIRWQDATVHVLSHVVSYGSSVFEGIRCYSTAVGPAIFRLPEHVRRMLDSAKIYRMEIPYTAEQLGEAMLEVVRTNKMEACYVKPIAMRGYGDVGVNGMKNPIDVYIACWEWGKYLGEEALAEGVDVCVSSWNRLAPNTLPARSRSFFSTWMAYSPMAPSGSSRVRRRVGYWMSSAERTISASAPIDGLGGGIWAM